MTKIESADPKSSPSRNVRVKSRPTVVQLLSFEGIPQDRAELWIRLRLFGRFSRLVQTAGSVLGIDYCIPEKELVQDFAEAQCTEDVIDGLHQYQKMRGRQTLFGDLVRPHHGKVLRIYWRIRRRAAKAGRGSPVSEESNLSAD